MLLPLKETVIPSIVVSAGMFIFDAVVPGTPEGAVPIITTLPNRTLLQDRMDRALKRYQRTNGAFAVLFIDIDNFKRVNDAFGHRAGDEVLVAVAKRLHKALRGTDTVARLGGDESAAIVERLGDAHDATYVAEKVRYSLSGPLTIGERVMYVTVSIGIALCPLHCDSISLLVQYADVALYQAKATGKNQSLLFDEYMSTSTVERMSLAADLRNALVGHELFLAYQPQVERRGTRVRGVEGLLRWNHPRKGLVSSGEFVPIAEETGLIVQIGD